MDASSDGPDGVKRAASAAVALVVFAAAAAPASAQIYTRKNEKGVVEATNVPERGYRLTYPGKGTVIHSRAYKLRRSYNGEWDHHIAAATSAYDVSLELVRAIIQVESDFDHLARSSKGAQGLMQLMPATAARFGVGDPFDPRQNIFGGVQYLRFLLDLFQGDVVLAAAAYNAGENAVLRYNGVPPYRETRGYVEKVQALLGNAASVFAGMTSYVPGPALVSGKQNATAPPAPPLAKAAGKAGGKKAAAKAKPKPQYFYKWKDAAGIVHVAQTPPADGSTYTTIRAND
jgi:soluble lytic murein transglycosylase-like protein